MKKLLAILLACSLVLGVGAGCSNGGKEQEKEENKQEQPGGDNQGNSKPDDNTPDDNTPDDDKQEEKKELSNQEWYTVFKNTVDSLCVTDYEVAQYSTDPLFMWKNKGTLPNDKNCKVTMTGADGKMMAQVVVAEGKAFLEIYSGINYRGDEANRPILYLENTPDGKMTGYQCGLGEPWGPLVVNHADEWTQNGLFGVTSPLDYLLSMGLMGQLFDSEGPVGETHTEFTTYFAYSHEKGGWVSMSWEMAQLATHSLLDGEVVYKIKDDKIAEIILTGTSTELGLKASGSVVYSFVYGGQKVEVPPEVIEAATK